MAQHPCGCRTGGVGSSSSSGVEVVVARISYPLLGQDYDWEIAFGCINQQQVCCLYLIVAILILRGPKLLVYAVVMFVSCLYQLNWPKSALVQLMELTQIGTYHPETVNELTSSLIIHSCFELCIWNISIQLYSLVEPLGTEVMCVKCLIGLFIWLRCYV